MDYRKEYEKWLHSDALTEAEKARIADGTVKRLTDAEARLQELKNEAETDGRTTEPAETAGTAEQDPPAGTDTLPADGGLSPAVIAVIAVTAVVCLGGVGGAAALVYVKRKKQ